MPACFDLRETGDARGDVRDRAQLVEALAGAHGVIHLAAISRVLWGERDPEACWATNVGGTRNVLDMAASARHRPWVIFASSREVYGQPEVLPATEETPVRPMNIYGRSKAEGEQLVEHVRRAGTRACSIRLSNVFGAVHDHDARFYGDPSRARELLGWRPEVTLRDGLTRLLRACRSTLGPAPQELGA